MDGKVSFIRDALVTRQHEGLYAMNADFRAAIDALAWMLPLMVNGLADDAESKEAQRRKMRDILQAGVDV